MALDPLEIFCLQANSFEDQGKINFPPYQADVYPQINGSSNSPFASGFTTSTDNKTNNSSKTIATGISISNSSKTITSSNSNNIATNTIATGTNISNNKGKRTLQTLISEDTRQKQDIKGQLVMEYMRRWPKETKLPFSGSSGLILANIDIFYQLTGNYISLIDDNNNLNVTHKIDNSFKYCCLGAGTGAVEYLQYRCPYSVGYGLTENNSIGDYNPTENNHNGNNNPITNNGASKGKDWDLAHIKPEKFFMLYGSKGDGNINDNCYWLIDFITYGQGQKLDLVVSHRKNNFMASALVAAFCCKEGGHAVFKLGPLDDNDKWIIYCLSHIFEEISFFRPMTVNPNSWNHYLVCRSHVRDDDLSLANRFSASIEQQIPSYGQDRQIFFSWWERQQNNYLELINSLIEKRNVLLKKGDHFFSRPKIHCDLMKLLSVLALPVDISFSDN